MGKYEKKLLLSRVMSIVPGKALYLILSYRYISMNTYVDGSLQHISTEKYE